MLAQPQICVCNPNKGTRPQIFASARRPSTRQPRRADGGAAAGAATAGLDGLGGSGGRRARRLALRCRARRPRLRGVRGERSQQRRAHRARADGDRVGAVERASSATATRWARSWSRNHCCGSLRRGRQAGSPASWSPTAPPSRAPAPSSCTACVRTRPDLRLRTRPAAAHGGARDGRRRARAALPPMQ